MFYHEKYMRKEFFYHIKPKMIFDEPGDRHIKDLKINICKHTYESSSCKRNLVYVHVLFHLHHYFEIYEKKMFEEKKSHTRTKSREINFHKLHYIVSV